MTLTSKQKVLLAIAMTAWAAFTLWIIAEGYLPF
jgi:hypothetical protein